MLVALPLLALRSTTSALVISGLLVAARLPWLIVALPAGAVVDRTDRRRLCVLVEVGRAAVVAGVAAGSLVTVVPVGTLYVAAFLIGAGETIISALVRSATAQMVYGEELVATNGWISAAQNAGTRFAGPGVGGVLFSLAASLPFFGDALSFVVSGVLLPATLPPSDRAARPSTTVIADIRSGLRWFAGNRVLRALSELVTSFAFCQAMVLAVLVLYATKVLHLGATGYGLLLAGAAVGDIVSSLLARRIHRLLGGYGTIVVAGAAAAAGYLCLSFVDNPYVAGLALALEAAASTLGNVATLSARQRIIPPERFGLINNAFRMPVTGSIPIGALVGGVLVTVIGFHATFLTAGLVQLAVLAALAVPLRLMTAGTRPEGPAPAAAPEPNPL